MRQEERHDGIRVCGHDSDYSALYGFVGMRHVMCNSCWHGEEHVRAGRDAASMLRKWQLCAANAVSFAVTPLSRSRGDVQDVFRHARQLGRCAERQQAQIMRIGTIKPKRGDAVTVQW